MKPIYHSYSVWRRALSSLPQAGCVLALAALSAGCTQNDLGDGFSGGGSKPGSFVTLSLTTPSAPAMRSNPTGGEQGDGTETGQDYENTVKRAVAFFYQGSGVNAGGTIPIQAAVPFTFTGSGTEGSNGIDRVYTTTPQTVDLENGTYHLLLVANPGTDWWSGKSLTLGDVRDHIQQQAWQQAEDGSYSDFVMTSAADATVTLNFNPENDPAKATVCVERMAARLDYQASGSYPCKDPQYSGATAEITGAALVNNLTAGSYLTKRVANDVNGTGLSYLGDETPDAGVQTNYVLDPWTAQKTAGNNSFTIGDATAQPAALYGVWFDGSWADPNQWACYVKAGTPVSDGSETWQRIGYTLENTTAATEAGSRYSTGVVFKAQFHPQGLPNYTDGATFFSYGTNLYASMEDMMQHFYGSVFTKDFSQVASCKTWGEVKDFIASTLLTNDPSGYYTWLKNQADGKANDEVVTETDAQSLTWDRYMLTECGYSKSADGVVTLDQNGKVTRTALRPTGVRTYEDATCYYTWWVRHSNDGQDDTNSIMEYAIVRNNIYKLKVNSIYSLGSDIPTDEDHGLVIEVYVNDWQLLDPETLPM